MSKCSLSLAALALVGLLVAPAWAEPTVKHSGNSIAVIDGLTDEGLAQVKEALGKVDQSKLNFALKNITDDDLARLCAVVPQMDGINIEKGDKLTSIAPLAKVKGLRGFKMEAKGVADLTPLAGFTDMMILDVRSKAMGPDLKWMQGMTKLTKLDVDAGSALTSFEGLPSLPKLERASISNASPADLTPLVTAMPNLTRLQLRYCTIGDLSPLAKLAKLIEINLYGAKLKDFTPLGQVPQLREITYYAVDGADFSTLKALKQVQKMDGGLTKLNSIDFVAELPNLRDFDVFAEYVTDYSPLAKSKIEKMQIWNMREPVGDLGVVGKATSLKELRLWSVEGATNSKGLAGLVNLEKLEITSDYNKKGGDAFDLACAAGLQKLKVFEVDKAEVVNEADLSKLVALEKADFNGINARTNKPFDIAGLAKLGKLYSLVLRNCTLANADALAGCTGLQYLVLQDVEGVTNTGFVKSLTKLKRLTVTRGLLSDDDVKALEAAKVKVEQKDPKKKK